jgi:pyruvate formate lyase activating enzyme
MIDFPEVLASEIFTGGCNFKCPFCHNGDLVANQEDFKKIDAETVLEHLSRRKNIIEGLVISGGEPTLCKGLFDFIEKVKETGMKVKLDTNGYNPDVLEKLVSSGSLDYIAMDIKNSFERYEMTVGVSLDIDKIKKSIHLIKNSGVDYEFRTTLIKEFHDEESIHEMASIINGSKKYFLQQYEHSPKELSEKSFDFYTLEEMKIFKKGIEKNFDIELVELRGRF